MSRRYKRKTFCLKKLLKESIIMYVYTTTVFALDDLRQSYNFNTYYVRMVTYVTFIERSLFIYTHK